MTEVERVAIDDSVPEPAGTPGAADRLRYRQYRAGQALKAHVRRKLKAPELKPVLLRQGLRQAEYVAILTVKDEAVRFPYLLRYYRGLGIQHFLVIDNESTDGLSEMLASEPDVSIYLAAGRFKDSRSGYDWVNEVLNRHGHGKWILLVDADEFLVVAHDAPDIPSVCAELERQGRRSLQAVMLDMYSDRLADDNVVAVGQDPLEVCDLYDSTGYIRRFNGRTNTTWIKGGVRGRIFFRGKVWTGPALNKTPLMKWRRGHAFLKAAHQLFPHTLNGGDSRTQAALLHFKFTTEAAAKAVDPVAAAAHTAEYEAYGALLEARFVDEITHRYEGPHSLVADGILTPL